MTAAKFRAGGKRLPSLKWCCDDERRVSGELRSEVRQIAPEFTESRTNLLRKRSKDETIKVYQFFPHDIEANRKITRSHSTLPSLTLVCTQVASTRFSLELELNT